MTKANKAMFEKLQRTKTIECEYDGDTIEFEIKTLKVDNIVTVEEAGDSRERFELLRFSLEDSIPGITLDDVMGLPLSIAEKLLVAICEFNDIEVPKDIK